MSDHPMSELLDELAKKKEQALHAGSEASVQRQHDRGKMPARERAGAALNQRPYTDGCITGFGTVDGRKVCIFSQDFTVFGGALGEVFAEKIHKIMDLASSVG